MEWDKDLGAVGDHFLYVSWSMFMGILATPPRNKGLIFGLIKGNQ